MRWDAPLLSALAHALAARLHRARLRALVPEFEARRLTLYFREATVSIRMHPREAGIFVLDPAEPPDDARPAAARLRSVAAVPDDRVVIFSFLRVRGAPAEVDVITEWITNRHNMVVADGPERTVRMAFRTYDGRRTVRQGHPYALPPASPRAGVDAPVTMERWCRHLDGPVPDRGRPGALMSTFAWTSPINVHALLAMEPADGYRLWCELGRVARGERPPVPVILQGDRGPQPYPLPLPGRPHAPAPDLLVAMIDAAGTDETAATVGNLMPAGLLQRLERRVDTLRIRCARLEEEWEALEDAGDVQALGDLLLARFDAVPRGASSVRLTDFSGTPIEIALDPTLTPDANARAYYDEAARIRRARERLPRLATEARSQWSEAERLLEQARAGEVEAIDVERALPADPSPGDGPPTLPYRRYRSSGGLEIRVGRGARRNDDLTFRHSAPDDIWLHARDVAGAHVILRWGHDDNPPARDLAEAAVLAALGSKARTSGSVPVDWTRRKYVRKPRKSPPGRVVPDRVTTVFVEPDPATERRLRDD